MEARLRLRVPVKAGPHAVGVAFVEALPGVDSVRLQPFLRSSYDTLDWTGRPHIEMFSIAGPLNPTGSGDTPSRRRIFVCRPASRARRTAVRRPDHLVAGAARLSPAADAMPTSSTRCGSTRRPPRRIVRDRHSGGAAVHPGESQLRVPRRARPGGRGGGHGRIASATSSWRRASRSFSGAASPTTSCWTRRRADG